MKPNIVYIHSHDTGRYIEPYGFAVPTPNLQKLAEQGVLFRKAFSAAPTCSPSRAALLTGLAPHSAGMLGLAHRGFALNDYSQHLVHTLHQAGYFTALAGVQHVASKADQIGYDLILGGDLPAEQHARLDANRLTAMVTPFLRSQASVGDHQPFFLSVGFVETHREFPVSGWQEDPRYTMPPIPIADTPQTRQDMANFKASARMYDRGVGDILNLLDELNLAENTLVIATTDHGIAFPGMKCNLTDHGIGVMLIMRGPGGFTGGKVIDAMVSHVDIFPTLCDFLGIEQPGWLQGKSMMPLIEEGKEEINHAIFGEVTFHAAYEPMRCIRTQRYKYIRRFDTRTTPVLPNIDDSPSKSLWLQSGYAQKELPREFLYDLNMDPTELHNLADQAEYQATKLELATQLHQWMVNTNDILLQENPVIPPHGALVNHADQQSPSEPVTCFD
ncbi:MAG: sulfatase [Anaerolineae bacterium]|nr:sulfatase [Anaerolineae bacterium]